VGIYQDPDPGRTTHIIFPDGDPGLKKFGSEIRDGKNSDPRSGINIPDPQH
jgi:hypothetical protein